MTRGRSGRSILIAAGCIAVSLAGLGQAAACEIGSSAYSAAWGTWLQCDHPLCGRGVWLTAPAGVARCEIGHEVSGAISGTLGSGGIAVIGETHDNALHHKLRSGMFEGAVAAAAAMPVEPKPTPAVVFEQLRADQQPAIDAFLAQPKEARTLGAFMRAVDWETSGWARYDYKPLLEAVLAGGVPIFAGDPPRDLVRKAAKEGPTALPADELARLGLDQPLGDKHDAAMLDELEASHCGLMPRTAFGNMAFAQRLRDAYLADAALRARDKYGTAIVFAGNGHARNDRGIGWYVARRSPGISMSTTQLIEVEDGKIDPAGYVPRDPAGQPAADFVVFTPRMARPDPCEDMRKSFGKGR